MPDQVGLELIAGELAQSLPGAVRGTTFFRSHGTLEIEPAQVREVLAALRERGYRALMSVHGVDYYPEEPRLGVLYELLDMERVDRVTVKLRVHTRNADGPFGDAAVADRRPPGARGLRHVRRASSTATRTCAGS